MIKLKYAKCFDIVLDNLTTGKNFAHSLNTCRYMDVISKYSMWFVEGICYKSCTEMYVAKRLYACMCKEKE